jgi:hypothetical protein
MKLISCNHCCVVLDQDKLKFSADMLDEEGCIDDSKARWDNANHTFELYVPCPVCEADVFKE